MFAYCLNNPVMGADPTGKITIATLILIGSAIVGAACSGYTAYKEYQAGLDTVQIIGDSICAGFAGFSIVYSGGMSLYQCYQNYCYLHGLTPVTEISFSNNTVAVYGTSDAPKPGISNSQYNKVDAENPDIVISTTQYNSDGRNIYRVDYYRGNHPHPHYSKELGVRLLDHVHFWAYNDQGYVNREWVEPF